MEENVVTLLLSKFDEINRQLAQDRAESSESRRRIYGRVEELATDIINLSHQLSLAEASITSMQPAVSEFITMRTKAVLAGKLGRFLWWLAGVSLSAAGGATVMWAHLSSFFRPPAP